MDVVPFESDLGWVLQGLGSEDEVTALVQVVVVHGLGYFGDGIVS